MEYYGEPNWQWVDEGLPNTIMDYHNGVGLVLNFTEDDWGVCKENGWTLAEVLELCEEKEFSPGVETLGDFFSDFPGNMTRKMSLLLLKIETIVADSAYKTPHWAFS